MKKRKLKSWVVVVFIILCSLVMIYSLYKIITWKQNVDENHEIKDEIEENIKTTNVNGTIKYYIDGEESRRPSFDNNWHYYCITGFNLSNWTMLKLNNYSNDYNCNINYSDFRLYNTILSLEDI